jgi:hypothetical protein
MITGSAPYAPANGISTVLDTYRDTGLGGSPITTALVTRLSMGDEVARRVVLSLRQLDLIDEEGVPTESLVAFKKAPSDEYRQVFANHLYDVYAAVFAVLGKDFSNKTPAQIEDAFRNFKPDSLRKRMVTCFLGLCQYAGIVDTVPKGQPGPKKSSTTMGIRSATSSTYLRPRPVFGPSPRARASKDQGKGDTYTVDLGSGGKVTLTVQFSLFDLDHRDREFIYGLIDQMKKYGDQPALPVGREGSDNKV